MYDKIIIYFTRAMLNQLSLPLEYLEVMPLRYIQKLSQVHVNVPFCIASKRLFY